MLGSLLTLLMLSATPGVPAKTATRSSAPITSAVGLGSKWGVVTSVLRSAEHNRAVGGVPNSFHLKGRAIDIARRPGVAHSQIDAAYRKAGFRLVESLDEGDHSHFAFALPGSRPGAEIVQVAAAASFPAAACAAHPTEGRRRPDRWDGCVDAAEPKPELRPLEDPAP